MTGLFNGAVIRTHAHDCQWDGNGIHVGSVQMCINIPLCSVSLKCSCSKMNIVPSLLQISLMEACGVLVASMLFWCQVWHELAVTEEKKGDTSGPFCLTWWCWCFQLQLQKTQYLQLGPNRGQYYGGSLPNVNQIGNGTVDLTFQVRDFYSYHFCIVSVTSWHCIDGAWHWLLANELFICSRIHFYSYHTPLFHMNGCP